MTDSDDVIRIHKVYFMIHPACWSAVVNGPNDAYFEETGVDLFLHMKSGEVLRVEISSLPSALVLGPIPDVTTLAEPAPETTQKKPPAKRRVTRAKKK